jgi:hypothetical protein
VKPGTEGLISGQTYFIVVFHDEDLTTPIIQTILFVEYGHRDDGSEFALFQELHAEGDPSKLIVDVGDAQHLVLDHAQLMDKLARCFKGDLASRR